jgi:hypothetical protein
VDPLSGRFAIENLNLQVSSFHIEANAPGFYPCELGTTGGQSDSVELDLKLLPERSIRGRVTDSLDKPLGGVTLTLYSVITSSRQASPFTSVQSLADGHFAFPSIPDGDYLIRCIGPINGVDYLPTPDLYLRAGDQGAYLVRTPSDNQVCTIHAIVTDASTHEPLPVLAAFLSPQPEDGATLWPPPPSSFVIHTGDIRIGKIRGGHWRLFVAGSTTRFAYSDLASAPEPDVEVRIEIETR